MTLTAGLVAILLAARPAFAMRLESESLPVKSVIVRRDAAAAAQPVAAQATEVQSVAAAAPTAIVVSVYAGPSTPVEAAPITIEPITLEPADVASVEIYDGFRRKTKIPIVDQRHARALQADHRADESVDDHQQRKLSPVGAQP